MSLLAVVFPGQGAQKISMGKDFYDSYSVAREIFEEANDLLGWNVSNFCFSGSEAELAQTRLTQVAIFVVEMAILKSIQNESLLYPCFIAGHSLGEYSALVASGALTFSEGLCIVNKRGQLMEEACRADHGMLAVQDASISRVEALCDDFNHAGFAIDLGCYNGPEQCVLAGENSVLSNAVEVLSKWGARTARLKVSGAFHSRWMQSQCQIFQSELEKISWGKMRHVVISNVSGEPYPDDEKQWAELLANQLIQPVNWLKTVRFLYLRGVRKFLEIGPGNVLSRLNHSIIPSIETCSISSVADIENGLKFAVEISPNSVALAFIARSLAYAAATKNSVVAQDEFEDAYRNRYLEVLSLYNSAKENSQVVSKISCKKAIAMLQSVLTRKGVAQEEQKMRWRELSWLDSLGVLNEMD